jgi:hypothetical protein
LVATTSSSSRVLDAPGFQENGRHRGGPEDEVVEPVDTIGGIDDLPSFSLDRLRMMRARALACSAQLRPDADGEVLGGGKEAVPGGHEQRGTACIGGVFRTRPWNVHGSRYWGCTLS